MTLVDAFDTRPRPEPGIPSGGDNRLRVLHVVEAFGGGVLEVVRVICERLAQDGHEVAIAYGTRPETSTSVRDDIDPRVTLIPMPWGKRTIASQARAAVAVRRAVRGWRPDVVHLHSSLAGVLGAAVLPRGIPTVYSPHAYAFKLPSTGTFKRLLYAVAERWVSRRVTMVGAVSLSEGRSAATMAGASRVRTIENGIPELDARVASRAPRAGRPRIVCMGRIVALKRPGESSRILARLTDIADVEWIGGAPPGSRELDAVEVAGVPVTGWLSRAESLAKLRGAVAYLHWSEWDGLALQILEAMANDVVVVASDIAPNRDVVGLEQVARGEDDAVSMLRRIVTDDAYREGLLQAQRLRAQRYGADRMVAEWNDLYGSLKPTVRQPERLRRAFTVSVLRRLRTRTSVILNYHGVGRPAEAVDPEFLWVAPERFEAQISSLNEAGFEFVTVAELAARADGGEPPPGLAAISFDDGMQDNHAVVLPRLKAWGIRATFYIVTGLIGQPNPWLAPSAQGRMMTPAELRDLVQAGMELGAHTVTHPDLSQLPIDACLREIEQSRVDLQHLTGATVTTFAYPFGNYGAAALEAVQRAGFAAAVTSRGRGQWGGAELPRAAITGKDGLPSFLLKVAGGYEPLFESLIGRVARVSTRRLRRLARSQAHRRRPALRPDGDRAAPVDSGGM